MLELYNEFFDRSSVCESLKVGTILPLFKGKGVKANKDNYRGITLFPGGTPILGHMRDVRPERVSFPGRKPADGCKFFTKNLRMGHNFDIVLPGNGWFSSKLNKTYCSLVNFYCKQSENGSVFGPALVCGWVNFPILWPHPPYK